MLSQSHTRLGLGTMAVVAVLGAYATGCADAGGDGVRASETRVMPFTVEQLEIDTVNATIVVDPTVTQTVIEVKGDQNLLPRVRTHLDGHRLVVDTSEGVDPTMPLEIVFKTPRLNELVVDDGSFVDLTIQSEQTLKIDAVDNTRITARGAIWRIEADMAGDAVLQAKNLVAKQVEIDAAGDAFASVCVTEFLDVTLNGSAEAEYFCNPHRVDDSLDWFANLHRR